MAVKESRSKKMQELIKTRTEIALREYAHTYTTKDDKGRATEFHMLPQGQFDKVAEEVGQAVKEYLAYDFWNKEQIEE